MYVAMINVMYVADIIHASASIKTSEVHSQARGWDTSLPVCATASRHQLGLDCCETVS